MRKKIIFFCAMLAGIVFLPLSVSAQDVYVWEYYGIQVTLPNSVNVTVNDENAFEAESDQVILSMHLFEEDISLDDMADAIVQIASDLDLDDLTDFEEVSMNGLEGSYIHGYKDGSSIYIVGLIDPNSQVNFFVTAVLSDEDEEAGEKAVKIINSFKVI